MKPSLSKSIKALAWLKLLALLSFLLFSQKLITIGEKNTQAAPPAESPAQESAMGEGLASSPSLPRTKTERQGFLAGLLELPSLDVEASKKDEIGRYLSLVERAKQQVEDRLKVLNQRASQLQALEKSIDKKLQALDEERKFFASTIQQEKVIQDERLATLVELYVAMEPKKAAPVFEAMDKDLVVALFKKMKKKQVTQILEGMAAEKSVAITEYFGRIGSAKEYNLLKEMNRSLQVAFNDCKGLPKP